MQDLKSSVHSVGEVTTQIFHYVGGEKRTFTGLITDSIKEGEMLKIDRLNGSMVIVNKKNLLMTEVFKEPQEVKEKLEDKKVKN